jgi:hypothetical protein
MRSTQSRSPTNGRSTGSTKIGLSANATIHREGIVDLLAGVRPNTEYVRIANSSGKAFQYRSARHVCPRLEGLGA